MSELVDRIAYVLLEHGGFGVTRAGSDNVYECDCRAPLGAGGDYTRSSLVAEWRAHVAGSIVAIVTECHSET